MRNRFDLIYNLILVPIDFLMMVLAFVLAYIVRVKIDVKPVSHPLSALVYLKLCLLILPLWILIFALSGLYSLSGLKGRWEEIGKIFVAVSSGTMLIVVLDFLSTRPILPAKAILIYGYVFSLILVILARGIMKRIRRYFFKFDLGVRRVLLVGSGEMAQKLAFHLRETKTSGYKISAVIDVAKGAKTRMKPLTVFRSLELALAKLAPGSIDELIQADSALRPDEILELVNYANNNHLAYRFVPNQFGIFATNSTVGTLAGVPMVEIRKTPLDGWGRVFKRVFDLVVTIPALIILSPIYICVGVAIKFSDPGPIFYRHKRLSRVGKPIYVLKFRTMYLKYCTGESYGGKTDSEVFSEELGRPDLAESFSKEQKLANDPRITSLGRFLRRTSLDELPQLINVLKGELSLVGPRPIVEAELGNYGAEQSTFLTLKPGITGLWQISGRSDLSYAERVKLDIYYIERWTIWLDLKILFKTIIVVFKRSGAY